MGLWKHEEFCFDYVEFKLPMRYLGGVHFITLQSLSGGYGKISFGFEGLLEVHM